MTTTKNIKINKNNRQATDIYHLSVLALIISLAFANHESSIVGIFNKIRFQINIGVLGVNIWKVWIV